MRIFLLMLILFLLASCSSNESSQTLDEEVLDSMTFFNHDDLSSKQVCQVGGGEWKELRFACRSTCYYIRNPKITCGQGIEYGCECAESFCWDGEKCVKI